MGVSYNRLWKMLIDKKYEADRDAVPHRDQWKHPCPDGENQYVSMETIEKICKKLDCTVDEMMEFTDDE